MHEYLRERPPALRSSCNRASIQACRSGSIPCLAVVAAIAAAVGFVGADANAAIVASLRDLSTAYTSLSDAAGRADRQRYAAASTAITQADAALAAGFARLREQGYTVG